MKNTLRLEELAMAATGIYLLTFHMLDIPAWIWFFIFFSPDLGMAGYLVNTKFGAITYNILHHKGIAITCIAIGYFMKVEVLLSIGILLFTHSSFDRIFGYGLKYYSSFNDTHLGPLNSRQSTVGSRQSPS